MGVLSFSDFFSALKDIFLEKTILKERQKTQKKKKRDSPLARKGSSRVFYFFEGVMKV